MPLGVDTTMQVLVVASAGVLMLGVFLRRRESGVGVFLGVAVLLSAWVALTQLHALAGGPFLGALATRLQLAIGAVAPVVWLAFVVDSVAQRRLAPRTLRLLALPSALVALAALAAPVHEAGILALVDGELGPGIAFWAASLPYGVVLLLFATLLLLDAALHSGGADRAQALVLSLAGIPIGLAIAFQGTQAPFERHDAITAALAAAIVLVLFTLGTFGSMARPAVAFSEVFLAMNEAALVVAPDGTVLEANPAAGRLLGEAELRGTALLASAPQLEVARRGVSGRQGRQPLKGDLEGYEVSVAHLHDGRRRRRGSVLVVHDERRDREHAKRLREDAFRDALTGIANRRGFEADVAEALANRNGDAVGLAFIDLDGFKHVNDTLGHAAGDIVLVKVARRLEAVLRDGDTVARLGGDEFALLLPGITPGGLAGIPGRIEQQLAKPIEAEGSHVTVGASVGLASAPRDGTTVDALLEASDERMYRQKRGKDSRAAGVGTPQTHAG